jgi:hypothetical protein
MREILIATQNRDKLREIEGPLAGLLPFVLPRDRESREPGGNGDDPWATPD